MARDEKVLRDFAERTASLLTSAGFPRMPARVLMALTVAEGEGMTAAEIGERLEISAAAVSGAVRYLLTVAMVRRVPQAGSRRDLYELPDNSWYTASLAKNPLYDAIIGLTDAAEAAAGDAAEPAAVRIAEMAEFFRFVRRRLPELLVEWEESRTELG
jgi:DNA-binding transcriptional regulator GbsR (MarR family)